MPYLNFLFLSRDRFLKRASFALKGRQSVVTTEFRNDFPLPWDARHTYMVPCKALLLATWVSTHTTTAAVSVFIDASPSYGCNSQSFRTNRCADPVCIVSCSDISSSSSLFVKRTAGPGVGLRLPSTERACRACQIDCHHFPLLEAQVSPWRSICNIKNQDTFLEMR